MQNNVTDEIIKLKKILLRKKKKNNKNGLTFCPRKSVFSDKTAIPSDEACVFFFGDDTAYSKKMRIKNNFQKDLTTEK